MIWDSHVHLKHGDKARTEYSTETIVSTMDAVGIEKSVVFAICTTTRSSIEMAERAVRQFPDRLTPYAYALPSYERPVYGELEQALSERGFRGIKLHAGECSLAEYVSDPVFELASRYQVPCLVDLRGDYPTAERLASAFPRTSIIIAHLGQYLCPDDSLIDRFIGLAQNLDNVLLDASGVVKQLKIKEAIERVGANRVIWGTDGPQQSPDTVAFARSELDRIRALGLDREAQEQVLGGSLAALLGRQRK